MKIAVKKSMRPTYLITTLLFIVFVSSTGFTQALYREGTHYNVINPAVETLDPSKVEVTEVFWYGCKHCYNFAPSFKQWSEKLPDYVYTRHMPAVWDPRTLAHAQLFYTAEAFNKLDVMHNEIFQAFNPNKSHRFVKAKQMYQLFAKHDISEADFLKTFNSFPIKNAVARAERTARAYGVTGTPTLVVNGKYIIKSSREMLNVANFLISREQALLPKETSENTTTEPQTTQKIEEKQG